MVLYYKLKATAKKIRLFFLNFIGNLKKESFRNVEIKISFWTLPPYDSTTTLVLLNVKALVLHKRMPQLISLYFTPHYLYFLFLSMKTYDCTFWYYRKPQYSLPTWIVPDLQSSIVLIEYVNWKKAKQHTKVTCPALVPTKKKPTQQLL